MNRRSALGMTATTGIALALSRARAFAQAVGPGPEMSALSTYMSAAGTRALPAEEAEHAKLAIRLWLFLPKEPRA
jgi:hypothetical protein